MPRGSLVVDLAPPESGARTDRPSHRLDLSSVAGRRTQNVIVRDGFLVPRPGLRPITGNLVPERPMGLSHTIFAGTTKRLVAGTIASWYRYDPTTNDYVDLSAGLTGDADHHVRFTRFPQGTDLRLIGVNGTNGQTPRWWNGSAASTTTITAGFAAEDVTTAANRVILFRTTESGTERLHRVRFSNFNDADVWSANDFADLSDTPGNVVGGRALTRIAFAIYKTDSQWLGLAQGGLFPFRFELQDLKAGPVSPAAIAEAEGRHYYLAVDGSIYTFDGIRTTHIGEPIRRWLLEELDFDKKNRAFSLYARKDRDVWFFFPSPGQTACNRAVSLNVDTGRFFPHKLGKTLTAGSEWDFIADVTWDGLAALTWNNIASTYATWDAMGTASEPVEAVAGDARKVHSFGLATDDDGTQYTSQWTYENLQPASPSKRGRVQSLDTFFEQASAAQTVTLRVGTTDTLGATPTVPAELVDTFDISVDNLHQATYDDTTPGVGTGLPEARFVTVEHQVVTATAWKWGGAHLRVYPFETS